MLLAVGAVVGLAANVAVLPNKEVAVAVATSRVGPSWLPAARAVWVATVLKIDSSGSSVG